MASRVINQLYFAIFAAFNESMSLRRGHSWSYILAVIESPCTTLYSVSEKKSPPLRTCGNFSKTVGNFSTKFCMPIMRSYLYARVRIFIQLPATLTKLCHIKRDHPIHIMCAKFPPSAKTHFLTYFPNS